MRRQRNLSFGKALLHLFQARIENAASVDHLTLLRSPCPELRAKRSRMKIFLGFFARSLLHFPFDPYLALHFHPIKNQCDVRILVELTTFLAEVICEKYKSAAIEILQENDARKWFAINTGRECHRIRIQNVRFKSRGKPPLELLDWIGIQLGATQSATDVFVAKAGVIEGRFIHIYAKDMRRGEDVDLAP